MTLSKEFRQRAWTALTGKYGMALLVILVEAAICGALGSISALGGNSPVAFIFIIIGLAATIFVQYPLIVGVKNYFVQNATEKPGIELMFGHFKTALVPTGLTVFLMNLKIFLWTLLLIVPGIIKSYEYAMIPYILAENPGIASKDAFMQSRKMMTGNKWRFFKLQFSFIGWILLATISCGIGLLFLAPYLEAAYAEFYLEVKNNA